jgi:hypothetical protein
MYQVSSAFSAARDARETTILYVEIEGNGGRRLYSYEMPKAEGIGDVIRYDGSASVGEDVVYGSRGIVVDKDSRLLNVSPLRETLAPDSNNVLLYTGTEIPSISFSLSNVGLVFSELLVSESFQNQDVAVKVGFPSLAYSDFLDRFSGRIVEERLTADELWLVAAAT